MRVPSIAAFEAGAECGARQWHRVGAPGGAGSYVTGPARPKAATPGNRGPAVARPEPRWVRDPRRSAGGASRRSIPLLGKRKKGNGGPARAPEIKARVREVISKCKAGEWGH